MGWEALLPAPEKRSLQGPLFTFQGFRSDPLSKGAAAGLQL